MAPASVLKPRLPCGGPPEGDSMKRRNLGRDAGLTIRMLLTSGLLGLVYVAFALALFRFVHTGYAGMIVIVAIIAIVQYFTSDRLALLASGARIVERDQAPDLHTMIERL